MADKEEGEGSGNARPTESDRSPENLEDNLSFLDKLKCMMYSKVERDAFLIEKLEKEEKKKAKAAAKKSGEASGISSQPNKKDKQHGGGLFGKMKTVFSSPTEEQTVPLQGEAATAGDREEIPSVDESSSLSPSGDSVAKPQ